MSIHDDIATLERAPLLRLLGNDALRMLAIGSETQRVHRGDTMFHAGDPADAGFVVRDGMLRLVARDNTTAMAGPGTLISETALVVESAHAVTAVAEENTTLIRISRSLFQKVLESDAMAAVRMRDAIAARTSQITAEITAVKARLDRGR